MPTTLLVSWNVAGWEATLKYVKTYYGSLSAYLDRHQIDILALQEVKVTKVRMSESAAALGAHLEGWDSFWCFNTTAKKGFNGVTTFARKGGDAIESLLRRRVEAPERVPTLEVSAESCSRFAHPHLGDLHLL